MARKPKRLTVTEHLLELSPEYDILDYIKVEIKDDNKNVTLKLNKDELLTGLSAYHKGKRHKIEDLSVYTKMYLYPDTKYEYGDCCDSLTCYIMGERLENDQEYEKRCKKLEKDRQKKADDKAKKEERERKLLEELKAKYETKDD